MAEDATPRMVIPDKTNEVSLMVLFSMGRTSELRTRSADGSNSSDPTNVSG
jgi:hypothetical protein